ncbi:MAG TPA: ComEA family DNA-binding protein [Firmicutes bacterium]|nr:ComEA family DNA-binding protein [Bacillota bacterium]
MRELSPAERLTISALLVALLLLTPIVLWRHGVLLSRGVSLSRTEPSPAGSPSPRESFPLLSEPAAEPASALAPDAGEEEESRAGTIVVHVVGAVREPGVYNLPEGARVIDAVRAAGGETAEAATWAMNLATRLLDGDKVYVPTRKEVTPGTGTGGVSKGGGVSHGGVSHGGGVHSGGQVGMGAGPRPIDINHASAADLDSIPGIGPALAQRIIAFRETNGPFARVDDLLQVPGIGPKTLDKMKDWLVIR